MAEPNDVRVLLYVRTANALRDKIRVGEIGVNDRFPSMDELCASYKISRNTMRQAMAVLREEGLIESTRGRGTVVMKAVEERAFNREIVNAISDPLDSKGISIVVVSRSEGETLPPVLAGVPGVETDDEFDAPEETPDDISLDAPEEEFDIDEAMKIEIDDDEL